ncbi:MAG: glycosyltransferase [Candidatus Paceibacterota bacterium]|jgi:glycosyltransferase involved in cell wall biosynthesis
MKLLMISTDRLVFKKDSSVALRVIEYAKSYEELHIIVFNTKFNPSADEQTVKPNPTIDVQNIIRSQVEQSRDGNTRIQLSNNCWVYPTRSRFKLEYPFDGIRIASSVIRNRGITDISCQDPFLTAAVGTSLKRRFSIPLEIQIHTDIGSPYYTYNFSNKIRKILAKRYLPQADNIRVVSDRIKQYLIEQLNNSSKRSGVKLELNIEVRPIVVDTERIKNTPIGVDLHKKYPQFEKIVLMASRLEPEKDIELAIKAWPEVLKKFSTTGLIIVGDGSQISNLKSQISKLHLDDFIILESWVNQATLASYYKTADIFLNTSLFEGYGMTLVEAQAAGCKIISTDVGVAREVGAKIVGHKANEVACGIIEGIS